MHKKLTSGVVRPPEVIIASILAGIAGILLGYPGVVLISQDSSSSPEVQGLPLLFGMAEIMPGVFELLFALAVLTMERWAWWMGIVGNVQLLVILSPCIFVLAFGPYFFAYFALIISILVCLFTPRMRHAFLSDQHSRVRRFSRSDEYAETSSVSDIQ